MLAALKGLPLYIIGGLLVALAVVGFLLKGAWQDEAAAQAENEQWATAVAGYQRSIQSLREEHAAANAAVEKAEADRRAVSERNAVLSSQLQEALRDDDDYQACRDVRLSAGALDAIDRMRDDAPAVDRADD